jgi:RNA polymerase sigma-70 factor (ECF subfamily)
VQEAFLRIARAKDRYQPTARFSTWTWPILNNLALNYISSRKRRHASPLTAASGDDSSMLVIDPADDSRQSPSGLMSQTEIGERVRAAIELLPDNQRMAVILRRYEEASYEDIAATLSVTVSAVKSLLVRARMTLAERLTDVVSGGSAGDTAP